jgi:hypothetical protein
MEAEDNKNNKIMPVDIIKLSLRGLQKQSPEAYDLIIEKAEANYFETHQSLGSLKKVAREIIQICARQSKDSED